MQRLACGTLEVGAHNHPSRGPALGTGLCDRGGALFVFLDEFHKAMTSILTTLRQLCLYPIFTGHLALDHLAYQLVELEKGYILLTSHFSTFPII